ncbi:MAG: DNA translocase FtsK 4TM domain-containing protein [Chloroflexota bacterium]
MAKKSERPAPRRPTTSGARRGKGLRSTLLRRSQSRSSLRKRSPSAGSSAPRLSSERKQDLIGLILIAAALFSVVSILSAGRGLLSAAWLDLLQGGFGWGSFAVPLGLLAAGLWLMLRGLRERLPRPRPEQVIGVILLYVTLLIVLHGLLGPDDWGESFALARQGHGGGLIGAALLELLVRALGSGGTVVAVTALALSGLVFSAGISLPELLTRAGQLVRRARARWMPPARQRPRHVWSELPPAPEPTSVAGLEMPRQATLPPRGTPVQAAQPPSAPVVRTEAAPMPVWQLPEVSTILEPGAVGKADDEFDRQRAAMIEETLLAFGAPARVVEINRGPTITQFGVEPDYVEGRGGRRIKVKVSKISALADDLALALAAPSIRIEAPVPGKGYVGIEVPNTVISLVALRDVMESEAFRKLHGKLRLGLGQDVSGHAVAADLTAMPHLLIAGTTGSGKSVCVNAIISCLLLQNTPDDLKFVMVDPKRVELTSYNGIPHLLAPVVVELERVVPALQWVSREMDERYRRFAKAGARNIEDFNRRMQVLGDKPIPILVVVIDELADLMMLAPDETERVITRLAQLARATGIHLIIATQRPSVDVVTGLIKANFPARIAFAVASSVDSRVILDQPGAERLLGRGDMLFQSPDAPAPVRMQGAFVSDAELARLIAHWKQSGPAGQPERLAAVAVAEGIPPGAPLKQALLWEEMEAEDENGGDALFDEAATIVRQMRRASISLLQRRLRIGYTRAARLIDQLEEQGIIGPAQHGSQAREVLDYGSLAPATED